MLIYAKFDLFQQVKIFTASILFFIYFEWDNYKYCYINGYITYIANNNNVRYIMYKRVNKGYFIKQKDDRLYVCLHSIIYSQCQPISALLFILFLLLLWLAFMRIKVAPMPPTIVRQCSYKFFALIHKYIYIYVLLFRTQRVQIATLHHS